MGGEDRRSGQLFSYINLEARVPSKHPLRLIRVLADDALRTLSPQFDAIYAHGGRPSIPPEWLLRALLLQTIYSLRSERQLMEHLDHNLLYRWFVGLLADDPVWDVTVFTKNRDRLLEAGIAKGFLDALLAQPKVAALLSDEHFSVDGTILEAAASMKSFVAKPAPAAGEAAPQTPVAAPQPEAGAEIAETAAADGSTGDRPSPGGVTLGADKAYDTKGFVGELDSRKVAPHIARNTKNRRSAVPDEVAATPGYATSIRVRKRIEEVFGWMKTVGAMRKLRHRGTALVGWMFTLSAAAYNLVRLSRLIPAAA